MRYWLPKLQVLGLAIFGALVLAGTLRFAGKCPEPSPKSIEAMFAPCSLAGVDAVPHAVRVP